MTEPERAAPLSETPTWGTDPSFQPPRDLTGSTLGDFHVERKLGQGGMGEVYLATQVSLNRPVALKVLKPDLLENPTYRSRFEAEAWSAAKLNHPNIVHIYMVGCVDNVRFIAMEYVQGTNLREYIDRKGPPELPLALSIMRQAGQAIGAAGEQGLVHRDIKPENLLLTRKGQVKVADFGLCRDKEGRNLHMTQEGVTLGTPMYMSPEQVQGHVLDHRSDLYSLGVTFYHMLAGQPPFRAETALSLALKHVRDQPVSLAVHRPDLPRDLVDLVMKLMAKSPADRYPSAQEMLRDLSRVKGSLQAATGPVSMPDVAAHPGAVSDGKGSVARPAVQAKPPKRPLRGRLEGIQIGGKTITMIAVLAAAIGGVGGWFARADDLLREGSRESTEPPGLWMAPWERVAKQPSAAAQYQYALVRASEADRAAAWLAVPGRFPTSSQWIASAYTQLARHLFRHHDAERLDALAAELKRSTHHEQKKLAGVVQAGAMALRNDVDGVLDILDGVDTAEKKNLANMDMGLAELGLEIVLYTRSVPGAGQHTSALAALARMLQQTLRIDVLDPANLGNPAS